MKAICVFSGGLDSILAATLVRRQGIDVLAVFFETPFFTHHKAEKSARIIDIPFRIVDITEPHLEVIKQPKHGYGKHMNPCIDCHALMFRMAGQMLRQEDASFVITGEVLGQRPMSQNIHSLNRVAAESGAAELLLRPLSAKHLPPTVPEKEGWVDRELLMNIQGRSRKPQIELAEQLGIKGFPTPGGGCLLTEKTFSYRLKELLGQNPDPTVREIELLKLGRHFRIRPNAKIVVGRNKAENDLIASLAGQNDLILSAQDVPGPTVLGIGHFTDELTELAARITASYSDTETGKQTVIRITNKGKVLTRKSKAEDKKGFRPYML